MKYRGDLLRSVEDKEIIMELAFKSIQEETEVTLFESSGTMLCRMHSSSQ